MTKTLSSAESLIGMLAALLCELYSADELLRFVSSIPGGQELSTTLPGAGRPNAEIAHAVAWGLHRRGLVDSDLFARLGADRPRRRSEIDAASRAWLQVTDECFSSDGELFAASPDDVIKVILYNRQVGGEWAFSVSSAKPLHHVIRLFRDHIRREPWAWPEQPQPLKGFLYAVFPDSVSTDALSLDAPLHRLLPSQGPTAELWLNLCWWHPPSRGEREHAEHRLR